MPIRHHGEPKRTCIVCGHTLEFRNSQAKTCSPACRQALCRALRAEMSKLAITMRAKR